MKKKVALIASRGTLDWCYPPMIIGSTAAALDMEVQIFFTFYGLKMLLKKGGIKVTPIGNPAMPMKMPFGPKFFQKIAWPIPNFVTSNIPFFDDFASAMMKMGFKNKGVASIPELRSICIESGVTMIGCQMTMDVFGFEREEMLDEGIILGGAATFLEFAAEADVQMFM